MIKIEKPQSHLVCLKVFKNRVSDYTFQILKNFDPGKAKRIILTCCDANGSFLQSSEITDKDKSGLATYNDLIDTFKSATLRSEEKVRNGIINKYDLKQNQKIAATLTILEDRTHQYKLIIPVY